MYTFFVTFRPDYFEPRGRKMAGYFTQIEASGFVVAHAIAKERYGSGWALLYCEQAFEDSGKRKELRMHELLR